MRVLGIDTSLRSTGIAVVERDGSRLRAISYETLNVPAKAPHTACFRRLCRGLDDMLDACDVQEVSIEGAFFFKNAKTALILGEVRGAAIATCAKRDLPVFEYAPRRVKQAVVGHGNADKKQVRQMIMQLLGLSEEPQEDAADALALAVCHIQSRSGHAALAPKSI
ncbi:MAG: crossover junction endodeoxyribonuclease RuvC [Kiritimatiellae bacterium]|nr:crossover junction endodeoxyribonuclease RuvC [Kiritimatiellia bacterium]